MCSCVPARDACEADGHTIRFRRKESGQWEAMEALSVICGTHNQALQPIACGNARSG